MAYDALIVGGGLFGGTIAHALHAQGRKVVVFDDQRPNGGTAPSGGLMKPGWFAGLGKDVHEPALALLDRLFGVETVEFDIYAASLKIKREKVFRLRPKKVTKLPEGMLKIKRTVVSVRQGAVDTGDEEVYEAPLVIVAAGVWCRELMRDVEVKALKGVSFQFNGELPVGIIKPWAPYKQIVAHQMVPGLIWGGDGSAILEGNWTAERIEQCKKRVRSIMPEGSRMLGAVTGLRPKCPGHKPCLFEEKEPGLFVATGGAKNGSVAAGWVAHRILEETS